MSTKGPSSVLGELDVDDDGLTAGFDLYGSTYLSDPMRVLGQVRSLGGRYAVGGGWLAVFDEDLIAAGFRDERLRVPSLPDLGFVGHQFDTITAFHDSLISPRSGSVHRAGRSKLSKVVADMAAGGVDAIVDELDRRLSSAADSSEPIGLYPEVVLPSVAAAACRFLVLDTGHADGLADVMPWLNASFTFRVGREHEAISAGIRRYHELVAAMGSEVEHTVLEQVLLGGFETTAAGITNAWAVLRTSRNSSWRVPPTVDEIAAAVSAEPPLAGAFRYASSSVQLGEIDVEQGTLVYLAVPVPDGRNLPLSSHTVFGGGHHRCVGRFLGAAEVEASLQFLLGGAWQIDFVGDPPLSPNAIGTRAMQPIVTVTRGRR